MGEKGDVVYIDVRDDNTIYNFKDAIEAKIPNGVLCHVNQLGLYSAKSLKDYACFKHESYDAIKLR